MAYGEGQDDQLTVSQLADHTIISDAIPPVPFEFARQGFAERTWVGTSHNSFLKDSGDLIGDLLIELPELLLGSFGKSKRPGQASASLVPG